MKTKCSKVLTSRGDIQGTVTLRYRIHLNPSQGENHFYEKVKMYKTDKKRSFKIFFEEREIRAEEITTV